MEKEASFSIYFSVPKPPCILGMNQQTFFIILPNQFLSSERDALFPLHFSLPQYLGRLWQLQSQELNAGNRRLLITWTSLSCPPRAVPSHNPRFIWQAGGIGATRVTSPENPQQVADFERWIAKQTKDKQMKGEGSFVSGWMSAVSAWQQNDSKTSGIYSQ